MERTTRVLNEIGIGLAAANSTEFVRDIRVYEEGGSVQIWFEIELPRTGNREFLQYLTPTQAMAFAKAFERCAIEALKKSA